MATVAEVFMRLRVDPKQVKTDTEAGLASVDTKGAGKKIGDDLGKEIDQGVKPHGKSSGNNFLTEFSKGINVKGALIGTALTAGLASLPVALGAAGAVAGVALGAGLVIATIKSISTQEKALDTAIKQLQAKVKAGTATAQDREQLAADQAHLAMLQKQMQAYAGVQQAAVGLKNTAIDVFGKAITPLLGPFTTALTGIGSWLRVNQGMFKAFFAAAAPYVPVLTTWFEELVGTLLPIFTNLMRDALPSVTRMLFLFNNFVASGVGGLFANLTKALGPSVIAFGNLLRVIEPLLPAIGTLALYAAELLAKYPPLIPVIAGVVVALKGLLVISAVVSAFSKLTEAVKVIKEFDLASKAAFLTNPWVLLGVAVVAATILIIKYWGPISGFFIRIWHDVYSGFVAPLISWFTVSVPHAFSVAVAALSGGWGAVTAAWGAVVRFFQGTIAQVTGVFNTIKSFVTTSFDAWWTSNGEAIKLIWKTIWSTLVAVFTPAWNAVVNAVRTGWALITAVFTAAVKIIEALVGLYWGLIEAEFKAGMALITGVWNVGWAVLSTAVKVAWALVQATVQIGWAAVQAVFKTSIAVITAVFKGMWDVLVALTRAAVATVQTVIKVAWDVVVGIFTVFINLITGHWSAAWNALLTMLRQVWNAIKSLISVYTASIAAILSAAWNTIRAVATAVWNGIRSFFTAWWTAVRAFFTSSINAISAGLSAAWNAIRSTAVGVWNAMRSAWTSFWNAMHSIASAAWGLITSGLNAFWSGVKGGFSAAVSAIGSIWKGVQNAAATPIRFVVNTVYNNGIVPVVDAIAGVVGLHPLNAIKLGFKSGGRVLNGTTGTADDVVVRVSRNETILSEEHSKALAPTLSRMGVPGYALGGKLDQPPQTSGITARTGPGATITGPAPIPGGGVISNIGNAAVSIVKKGISGLRALAGDALAAGMNAILNPLLNAIPGGNTKIGQYVIGGVKKVEAAMVDWIKGASAGTVGAGSGSSVAAYAKSFATGLNHPYVTGGAGPGGWDCSGFSAYVYDHFGYFPGKQGQRYGTSESQWADSAHLQSSGAVPGALAFFDGSGFAPPGHVGVVINPQQYVSAYDHAEGTVVKNITGSAGRVWGFRVPKGGFKTGAAGPAGSPPNASPGSVQALMQQMAAARGWTGSQWTALYDVEMAEAGFNLNAKNPSSGAYGVAQFINGPSQYAQYGGNSSTAAGQITGMLNYIAQRYGTPAAAWAHEQADHWYHNGGPIPEPVFGVGQSGRSYAFQAGENVQSREASMAQAKALEKMTRQLDTLIKTTAAVPAGVGGAIKGAAGDASWRKRYPGGGW